MSRIPIKYQLLDIKISNGSYTSPFYVNIYYKVAGSGTWITSHSNILVNKDGRINASNPVIFNSLLEKTDYEIQITNNIPGGTTFTETLRTNDNMTVGDSPIYLKQLYRGQQFTWFFSVSPNGSDPNFDTATALGIEKEGSAFYYPLLNNFREISEDWASLTTVDANAAGPVFANKENILQPEVVTQGKYFNGLNAVELVREANKEPGWLSSGEFFSYSADGGAFGTFISFNFYIDPINSDVYMLYVGEGAESVSFVIKWDDAAKNVILNNRGDIITVTDTTSGNQIQYNTWYTLRVNFQNMTKVGNTHINDLANTTVGMWAYLYKVDPITEKGKCVGKSNNPTTDFAWANNVIEVGTSPNFGYIAEKFSFGKPDKTSIGLTLNRFYKGSHLPLDVLDTVGSLSSTNTSIVQNNSATVQKSYKNLLKMIMFHKVAPTLVFTESSGAVGGITPFPVNSFLKLGDNGFTGSFPKVDISQASHINIGLTYSLVTSYLNQAELDSDAYLRVSYARYRYATDTVPSTTRLVSSMPIAFGGGTTNFSIDCSSYGSTGYACRVHVELILNNGALTKSLSIEFSNIAFMPTNTIGGTANQTINIAFATHLGSTNGTLVITDSVTGIRSGELATLNNTAPGNAQINLPAMTSTVSVTKHKIPQKWINSIKAASFSVTIPDAPGKYLGLPDNGSGAIEPIITSEAETIPKGTFQMGIESQGYSTIDDNSIVVGFSSFVHPQTKEVVITDPEDFCHTAFDIDFQNAVSFEAEKDKFYNLINTNHTQWGGYNGGVNGELIYFDESDKSLILECHGDKYPLNGEVHGVEKGPKDSSFEGYGVSSNIPNSGLNPDPDYALSPDKIKKRRVGTILICKKYLEYGSFLIEMKIAKGLIGVCPALWYFHYMEMYPNDPRWDYWIRRRATNWGGNYLVVNNEIDMELPSHTTMGTFSTINEVAAVYWDARALDDKYRIGVGADVVSNNGTWKLKSGTWLDTLKNIQTAVSNPYLPSSWERESPYVQERNNPDMSNVKFNNWIGEKSGGNGYGPNQADYEANEDYLALLTDLGKNYADGEYHSWDIHWYPDKTELWVDGVKVRENRAFVPFNIMKYTFGMWFPSNKQEKLESGELSWLTDRGSWAGKKANFEVAHMNIRRIKYTPFEETVAPKTNLEYFSESFPEAGIRSLSKI